LCGRWIRFPESGFTMTMEGRTTPTSAYVRREAQERSKLRLANGHLRRLPGWDQSTNASVVRCKTESCIAAAALVRARQLTGTNTSDMRRALDQRLSTDHGVSSRGSLTYSRPCQNCTTRARVASERHPWRGHFLLRTVCVPAPKRAAKRWSISYVLATVSRCPYRCCLGYGLCYNPTRMFGVPEAGPQRIEGCSTQTPCKIRDERID
jgi:hypothetical protein